MKYQIKIIVCCVLTKKKYNNATYEELLLHASIIANETGNVNAATENRNLTAKTGNGQKHQQNRKKNSEQEKDQKPNKKQKKGKSVVILCDSMVKHLNGWETSKKIEKLLNICTKFSWPKSTMYVVNFI